MKHIEFNAPSSDGIHTLRGRVYLPEAEPLGFFHIVHGMTEHIARYDKIMSDLSKLGYIAFGYDNLGHGYTAKSKSELGFIAEKNGYEFLSRDVKAFSDAVFEKFSQGKKLPYYLMGHSMGSFIVRYSATKYVKPDKLIIMGTGGKNPAAGAGLVLISVIKRLLGERHISPLIDKIAFGSYNSRFGGYKQDDNALWLTRDKNEREKYYADELCTFKFTVSAMGDLISLIKLTNSKKWYSQLPNNLPILVVSGENDPVGSYGKGVLEVCSLLKKSGHKVECILYKDARHEILNDSTYEAVKADILNFIKCS